jgi:hypothetical protein
MAGTTVDVDTYAVELRRALIHAVRRVRPLRLVLDPHDVADLDPIILGTLAAACRHRSPNG